MLHPLRPDRQRQEIPRRKQLSKRGVIRVATAVMVFWIAAVLIAGQWAGTTLAQEPASKHPVPSKAVQSTIGEKLAEIFDFAAAKKPEQQIKLAEELFKLSEESKKKPDEQFVLLRKTMDLASEGGDATLMIQAIDVIGHTFDVKPMDVKVTMLQKFAKEAKTPEKIDSLMEAARPVFDIAMKQHNYDVALRLVEAIYAAAQRPGGTKYRKRLLKQRTELREVAKQYEQYQAALKAIEKNPADKAACLVLGRWRCFVENNWKQGLFYLAESDDDELKAAADRELKASSDTSPGTANDSAKVGDAWWDIAQKRTTDEKLTLLRHAAVWYQKSLGQEVKGLAKIKIQKRLTELEETLADAAKTDDEPGETPTRRPTKRKRNIVFRADRSMPLFPVGTTQGSFPKQQTEDPLGPFKGFPVYFQQKGATKTDIYYEVEWYPPVRQIHYRGAAWKNMTMEVLDPKGQVVARFGPQGGGNTWLNCSLAVPPGVGGKFVLHFHNEVSTWFFINNIVFQ